MAISDDAAAIAASNLVAVHIAREEKPKTGPAANSARDKALESIPRLFKGYMDVVQRGLSALPPGASPSSDDVHE